MPTKSGEEGCRDEAAGQSAAKVGYRIVKHPATPDGGRYSVRGRLGALPAMNRSAKPPVRNRLVHERLAALAWIAATSLRIVASFESGQINWPSAYRQA
jgi:hypothetical protein